MKNPTKDSDATNELTWQPLGGKTRSAVSVVLHSNQLNLYIRGTDNTIYHKWWDGQSWKPSQDEWQSLGGATLSPITAESWDGRRVDLFVRGTDDSVYHKWWDGNGWRPSDTDWQLLGGNALTAVSAIVYGRDRIDLFVPGIDEVVHHKWWDGVSWQP